MKTTLKHLLAGREHLHFNLVIESRYISLTLWLTFLSVQEYHILLSLSSTDLHFFADFAVVVDACFAYTVDVNKKSFSQA